MSVRDDIMDEVQAALELLHSSDDYPTKLNALPQPYRDDFLLIDKAACPVIMSRDLGDDTVVVQSPTKTQYVVSLALFGFTRRDTWETTKAELNAIIASVQQLINSPPDLGSSILALQYEEGQGHYFDDKDHYGFTTIIVRIQYYVTNGTY